MSETAHGRDVLLSTALAGAAAVVALAAHTTSTPAAWIVAATVAGFCCLVAAHRVADARRRRALYLFAVAASLWCAGAVVRAADAASPPAAADVFWCLAVLPAIVGLVLRAPPGAFSLRLFVLDTIPVVLATTQGVRIASGTGFYDPVEDQLFVTWFGSLYVLLAVIGVQVFALYPLRRPSAAAAVLALATVVLAVAGVVWPVEALHDAPTGNAADALWTIGWLLVAAAAVTRAWRPAFPPMRPLEEGEGGLRTIPPVVALLALIVMGRVYSHDEYPLMFPFALAAFVAIAARYYLARRDSRRLLAAEAEARRQAERAEQLKDEFLALVSHELRTPLTSIRGYLELVLEEPDRLDAEQLRFLRTVERNTVRLLRLVSDLLFVAQIEAGRLTLARERLALDALAHESVEAARPAAEGAGIAIELDARSNVDLHADPARLGQVLDNLVSNAIKFSAEASTVSVRTRRDGNGAVIEVADSGIGIPLDEQASLFQPFFRARAAAEGAIQGTGLGLAIARALVEAHDGTIAVDSRPGSGTTMRVWLPLATGASPDAMPPTPASP